MLDLCGELARIASAIPRCFEKTVEPMPNRSHTFVCPLCEAEFKVVRVEAAEDSPNYPVCCPACKTEFPGREKKSGAILKYFLVNEPAS